jgi:hypothetical protein
MAKLGPVDGQVQPSAVGNNWMWDANAPVEAGMNALSLIREGKARAVPSKPAMYKAGPEALLDGSVPTVPLIGPETRVIAMGSCFAALFVQWLAENGFNRHFDADSDASLLRNPLESPVAVAQQFRWAFEELDPSLAVWFMPDQKRFEATETQRQELRNALETAEVLIITLGLAESWFDLATGEAVWRVPPADYEGGRVAPKVTGVAESVHALETIERLRRTHMPGARVIYTVSPIRFALTLRPMSALVANAASKAIIRASVDEFFRSHADEVGSTYFYFPSYEIVREYFVDPYSDNRHIHQHFSDVVIDIFARHYTTLPIPRRPKAVPDSVASEARATIVSLEDLSAHLQETCDRRSAVIEELKSACDERSAVIEELKSACDERLAVIERLNAELVATRTSTSSPPTVG